MNRSCVLPSERYSAFASEIIVDHSRTTCHTRSLHPVADARVDDLACGAHLKRRWGPRVRLAGCAQPDRGCDGYGGKSGWSRIRVVGASAVLMWGKIPIAAPGIKLNLRWVSPPLDFQWPPAVVAHLERADGDQRRSQPTSPARQVPQSVGVETGCLNLWPEGYRDSGFWPSAGHGRALRRGSNAARTRDAFISDWNSVTCAVPGTGQPKLPASQPPTALFPMYPLCTPYVLPMCSLCAPRNSQEFLGAHREHIGSA